MTTRNIIQNVLVAAMAVMLVFAHAAAANKRSSTKLQKPTGTPVVTYLDINNISTPLRNNGVADINVAQTQSAFTFPKGSGKTAIFESGFLWGARIAGDPQVRIGGSSYGSGLQPGKILSPGVAENPDLPKNRIYRVRPDYRTADLSSEISVEGRSAADIRAQYATDWSEWPATDGAPYKDVDSNGVYDPTKDIPGVPGADQTVWFVANDLNATNVADLYGAQPLGIECQYTAWAYSQSGALGNMIFKSYMMINKSNLTFDSMYVAQWADPDLGFADDDVVGCDTSLSLGFVYNGANTDANYSPLPPPAAGFDFFQGPKVTSPGSQAIFRGKVVPGYKNLPMTAFFYFIKNSSMDDPALGSPAGSTSMYNFMRGRVGSTGLLFQDRDGISTPFALAGDPVTGRGWLDGVDFNPGDRRMGLASGSFTMAPGDTQEVVVAEIAAGAMPGVDRISAVSLLKYYDKVAQLAYDNFFRLPSAPPAPKVTATELDGEILLSWGSDATAMQATESSDTRGFKFQGYNVYQFPTASASLSEARRVATFDIAGDGITRITDQAFDVNTGVVSAKVMQLGSDNGIKRFISIKNDMLKGNSPLINGVRYYYAVTSYSYNPSPTAIPNNLENPLQIMTVIPRTTNPGVRMSSVMGDTVAIQHTGSSDGFVIPLVVDPTKATGNTYAVSFQDTPGGTVWNMKNVTTGDTVQKAQTNQSGDDNYLIVDGVQVKVVGPPPGMRDYAIPHGTRRWTWSGAAGFELEGFGGAIGAGILGWGDGVTPDKLRNVVLRLAATDTAGNLLNPTDTLASYAYRYVRGAQNPPAQPSFAPFIVNTSGSYAYQDYKKSVPFAAYNVETNPPTRLMIGHVENNAVDGTVDGKYWPPDYSTGIDNTAATGPREWFFVFDMPYSTTPDASLKVNILNTAGMPIMWFATPARRGNVAFAAGDEFEIIANHINTPVDKFTFVAPTVSSSKAVAREDVKNITVFPNPYYGVNTEEINKYNRFVTFSHLPNRATIKIFNLAGVQVREIQKTSTSQFERWDLANDSGLPVGSGLYIVHIEMPDLDGATKILKVAVIQEQQILDRF